MQVGAVGAYSFTPYIYNTNNVNRASMNKVEAIGEDVTSAKTDFSALTQETTNPLKRGQSLDFAGILDMQLQMGRMNAARVMSEPEETEKASQAVGLADNENVATQAAVESGVANAIADVEANEESQQMTNMYDFTRAMQAYQPIDMYA